MYQSSQLQQAFDQLDQQNPQNQQYFLNQSKMRTPLNQVQPMNQVQLQQAVNKKQQQLQTQSNFIKLAQRIKLLDKFNDQLIIDVQGMGLTKQSIIENFKAYLLQTGMNVQQALVVGVISCTNNIGLKGIVAWMQQISDKQDLVQLTQQIGGTFLLKFLGGLLINQDSLYTTSYGKTLKAAIAILRVRDEEEKVRVGGAYKGSIGKTGVNCLLTQAEFCYLLCLEKVPYPKSLETDLIISKELAMQLLKRCDVKEASPHAFLTKAELKANVGDKLNGLNESAKTFIG